MSHDLPLMPSLNFVPKLSPRFAVYLRYYLLGRDIDPRQIFTECGIAQIRESESALPIATTKVIELFDLAATEADFIVLDRNIFDVEITDVGETQIVMSVVAGKVIAGVAPVYGAEH